MNPRANLNLIRVNDPEDPRVVVYANQRDQWLRARHRPWMTGETGHPSPTPTGLPGDLFIAEGDKVVRQLIASPHQTLSVLVSEHRLDHHLPFLEGLGPDTPVYVVAREIVDRIAGFNIHKGLLACGCRVDPGTPLGLARRSALIVVLEDLANHDNIGGIFRNVRALAPPRPGVEFPASVLLSPRCCDPLYRKALRVSMGNALHVPFATVEDWPGGLRELSQAGCRPLALTPDPGATDIRDLNLESDQVPLLLLGTEGPGLASNTKALTRDLGGLLVRIDIQPEADSLNVAAASAVALHRLRAGSG